MLARAVSPDGHSVNSSSSPRAWSIVAAGAAAGYLSGLFGVGGGIAMVPMLMTIGVEQRRAVGTSSAVILPTAAVGAASYGLAGDIDWAAAAVLGFAALLGAQLGARLLARLPREPVLWLFIAFHGVAIAGLWLAEPEAADEPGSGWVTWCALAALGLVTGLLTGLLGVGGGIIVVPALQLLLGMSDVVAKGTSLLMMVPSSLSAAWGHHRSRNFDWRTALLAVAGACALAPLGALTAGAIDPLWSDITFTVLLIAAGAQLAIRELRRRR